MEGAARVGPVAARRKAPLPPLLRPRVRRAAEAAQQMGFSLYLVGGPVRDLLLGQPVVDLDLVVEGDAIRLARHLAHQFGGRVVAHRRFGTAKWLLDDRVWREMGGPPPPDRAVAAVDFATARTEFYTHPTALPEVERSSIKQDLHRRDFTINTLAIRLAPPHWGELLDFYGGEADLREGVIRVLHSLSFIDDPTRILRAARLEARLGFRLDPRSEALIANALPMLNRVSGERIRHELELILAEEEPERALCRLERLGVLAQIHPALHCDRWLVTRFRAARKELAPMVWGLEAEDRLFVYWGLLMYRLEPDALRAVTGRLRIPRSEARDLERIPDLRRDLDLLPTLRQPSRICHLLEPYPARLLGGGGGAGPPARVRGRARAAGGAARVRPRAGRPRRICPLLEPYPARLLAVGWVADRRAGVRARLTAFQTRYRHVTPILTGEDLKAMGLRPGPLFGRLLTALRDARLDGKIATQEDEEALVRQMTEHGAGSTEYGVRSRE